MASFFDLLGYSLVSLRHRQLRSYLTVLGIVIGVASVVILVSISNGLYSSISNQLEAFGATNAVLMPGNIEGFQPQGGGYKPPTEGRLFERDYKRIKSTPGVSNTARVISARKTITYKDQNVTITMQGTDPSEALEMTDIAIESGRFLEDSDRGAVVIGSQYADDSIFPKQPMIVGSIFYVGDEQKRFRVIGILDESSDIQKSIIMMPLEDARELTKDSMMEDELTYVRFKVSEDYDFDETLDFIEEDLAMSRKVSVEDKDFSLITSDFILEQVGQIIGIVSAILGFIISISLVVGGVGVANTMYMSVMERTKEIGTLKAIGASGMTILKLIVIESALIGLAGGLLGLLVGWIGSLIIIFFGMETVITLELVVFAMVFSTGVGIVSGLLPALKASKLSPVVAMRYG